MAIQDVTIAAGGGLAVLAPASGIAVTGSVGLDLNPDFGTGQEARKSPIPGMGATMLLRVDVFTAFVVSAGTPVAQFHVVLSTTTPVISGTYIVIGSSLGPQNTIAARQLPGYIATDLVLDNHFFIRFNPWTAPMGRATLGRDLRYLGLIIQNPNSDEPSGFSAGILRANLVKEGEPIQNPKDFIYPSGTRFTG